MKTKFGVAFAGISAIAAITIAGLAVWGAFFTGIPETLIRQLRSDISAAREESVDLRREKRLLQEEVEVAQAKLEMVHMEVAAAEETRTSLERKLERVREELDSTQHDFMVLDEERLAYFSQTLVVIVTDFTLKVNAHLEQLIGDALLARQLPELRSWIMGKDVFDREVSATKETGNAKQVRSLVEERLDAFPSEWKIVFLREKWTRDEPTSATHGSGRSTEYVDSQQKPYIPSDEEILEKYEERFTRSEGTVSETGGRVFDVSFQQANVDLLLKDDQNKFMNRFQAFKAANEGELLRPLSVLLPVGWTDREIVERAEQVLGNLEKTRTLLSDLKMHLLSEY